MTGRRKLVSWWGDGERGRGVKLVLMVVDIHIYICMYDIGNLSYM